MSLVAKKQDYEYRMNICKECDSFQKAAARCKECGCFMKAKARLRASKCPLDKWGRIEEE